MQITLVKTILKEELKATADGDTFSLPAERKLVLLVKQGESIMQIQRVHQVRFAADYLAVSSDEDIYFIDPNLIFGLKGSDPALDKAEKRPGFHR